MPKVNKELRTAGYLIIKPTEVMNSVPNRKPGYLDEFMKRAKLENDLFYILPEDYNYLRRAFSAPDRIEAPEAPARNMDGLINSFLRSGECPLPEWQSLFDEFQAELKAKEDEGCAGCHLNAIRKKWAYIMKQHVINESNAATESAE